jgi:membrane-associated phospholipid phosphatase
MEQARWERTALHVSASDPRRAWYRRAVGRVRRNLLIKSVCTPLTIGALLLAYRQLLKYPVFPVTQMPLTVFDDLIGFWPPSLLPYVTLWLYVSIPPALLQTRRELVHYGFAVGGLCLIGFVCFLLWPTAVPQPGLDRARHLGFNVLQGLDAAGNACPSLHVATALFSAIWLEVLLAETGAGRIVRGANWLWCLGIVYSTMATKQHVAIDVLAGAILGLVVAVLAVWYRARYRSLPPGPRWGDAEHGSSA